MLIELLKSEPKLTKNREKKIEHRKISEIFLEIILEIPENL